jgi:3',5'-cyclic AMP phosphodiesterase CpdA
MATKSDKHTIKTEPTTRAKFEGKYVVLVRPEGIEKIAIGDDDVVVFSGDVSIDTDLARREGYRRISG